MKKVIVIGKTGSGKTTLIQRLEDLEIKHRKTQTVEAYHQFIDTPGEYLEHRSYYGALLVTAVEADIIGLVEDCTSDEAWFAPKISAAFGKPAIGIVTKTQAPWADADKIKKARRRLLEAGACEVFEVSALEGAGIEALKAYIDS